MKRFRMIELSIISYCQILSSYCMPPFLQEKSYLHIESNTHLMKPILMYFVVENLLSIW